jgi:hypothetical protein
MAGPDQLKPKMPPFHSLKPVAAVNVSVI